MDQLTIFDMPELTVDVDQLERDAMLYTVKSIMRSDSNRNIIKGALEAGDHAVAFDWFHNSTTTYGFGDSKYNFSRGRIRVEGKHEFKVTSRELFNALLEIKEIYLDYQSRFQVYLNKQNKRHHSEIKLYEYMSWITTNSAKYKQEYGLVRVEDQEHFTEYLKEEG